MFGSFTAREEAFIQVYFLLTLDLRFPVGVATPPLTTETRVQLLQYIAALDSRAKSIKVLLVLKFRPYEIGLCREVCS